MLPPTDDLLDRLIRSARIRAETEVMLRPAEESVTSLICTESRGADIVLMGLRAVDSGQETSYSRRLAEFVRDLPTVLFVRSAGEFRGRLLGDGPDDVRATHEGRGPDRNG